MRYAVIGDIHANFDALETILKDAEKKGFDRLLCVGDLVGYGAMPAECIEAVRARNTVVVAGNHDFGVVDKTTIECFNSDARDAVLWTREHLNDDQKNYLKELQLVHEMEDLTLVHGTLCYPEYFDYIQTLYDAYLSFQALHTPICFLGHSHVPIVFFNDNPISYFMEPEVDLENAPKVIVNVGSVGQPRDQDARACYAIFDADKKKVWIHRVEYDVEKAKQRILDAGLPPTNAHRLILGR
ncbi:MAG TPA: metallophosphoesterase family protein [Candidatus Brocadiia bacterium]|nr:metallophosphoesterase family protein [Candidatus Brocadiia bacterium]